MSLVYVLVWCILAHSRRAGITPLLPEYHSRRRGITPFYFHSRRKGITPLLKTEHSPRRGTTPLFTQSFSEVYYNPVTETWKGVGTETKLPIVTMLISGVNIRPYIKRLKLTKPLNGKMRLDCTFSNTHTNNIEDAPSNLVPPGYGSFEGLIRQANTIGTRYLSMTISVAGMPWTCPVLVPLNPTHNGKELNWSFEGRIRYMERSNSTFEDVVWDLGDRKTAHQIQDEMGRSIGLSIISNFPNFTVSRLDRGIGSILGPVDAVAKVMQAGKREVGGSIVYQQAKLGPPKWVFKDRLNISILDKYEQDVAKNRFDLSRIETIGGAIGTLKSKKPGYNTIQFSPASKNVQIEITSQHNCTLHTWDYFDTNGTQLNGAPEANFFNSSVPIASARMIAEPGTIDLLDLIEFSLFARGSNRPNFGGYSYTAEKTELQTDLLYGVQPELREIQDSAVLDYSTLVRSGKSYLAESIRNVHGLKIVTEHANPHIEPGDTVQVTDRDTRQDGALWLVENHVLDIDFENNGYTSELICSAGEPGIVIEWE